MSGERLLALAATFAPLSLMAFGGGQAIVGEMQNQTVSVQGWLTEGRFADLFAIARAAPGPSTLLAALIGYDVAGLAGALVATLAVFVPSSLLIYAVGTWWMRHRSRPLGQAVERGLIPVAVGLIFSGGYIVLGGLDLDPLATATIVAALLAFTFTKVGAYTVLGAVAALYLAVALVS